MTESLTLPGDIPGLLRARSPVVWDGDHGWTVHRVNERGWCAIGGVFRGESDSTHEERFDYTWEEARELRLDLTDPTGRAHLLWWAERGTHDISSFHTTKAEEHAIALVRHGRDCTEADIIALRGLGLRIAGRTA